MLVKPSANDNTNEWYKSFIEYGLPAWKGLYYNNYIQEVHRLGENDEPNRNRDIYESGLTLRLYRNEATYLLKDNMIGDKDLNKTRELWYDFLHDRNIINVEINFSQIRGT